MSKKEKGYSRDKINVKLNRKRQEAIDRQNIYNRLSIPERLDLIKTRRGESKKESNRLITHQYQKTDKGYFLHHSSKTSLPKSISQVVEEDVASLKPIEPARKPKRQKRAKILNS